MGNRETYAVLAPRRHWKAPLLAVVGFVAAGGAGYYAWQVHQDRGRVRAEAVRHRDEGKALAATLEQQRATAGACQQELDTTKAAREEVDTRLAGTDAELTACRDNVTDLAQQKAEAAARLKEFASLSRQLRKMIGTGTLEVMFRRGKMVVKFSDSILFPSGSAELTDEGRKALAEVAAVLKPMRGRRFTVAGHTDNVPVAGTFKSNWELSTARAVKVVELLVQKGVRPGSLVAAGYGEHDPAASNHSKIGRQRNRRIEIILEPELRKLALPERVASAPAPKAAAKPKP